MLRFTARGLAAAVVFSLTAVPFAAAQAPADTPYQTPAVAPAPPTLMAQFDVAGATLQSLQVPLGNPGAVTVDVVLAGRTVRIVLTQHDVRAPNFQLIESGPNGYVVVPTPLCVTYRGYVEGDTGSEVAATIEDGTIDVFAKMSNGEIWAIQPVREVQPAANPALHVVYRSADSVAPAGQCGVQAANLPVPTAVGEDILYEAQIACDADYPFYQQNGSNSTNTQNDITGIVNAMSVIYENDVDITFQITQILVRTSSGADPYSSTGASTLLNQFGNHWNAFQGGIQRDLAHLFTGRNIQGGTIGIATLGTVCNISSAYGLSQSRYTSNYTLRVSLTAHEIGHNFGAGHCDNSPPCHIMCSGNGGCSIPTLFGTTAKNQINSYRQSFGGCLSVVQTAPLIQSVNPVTIKTANPPQVTLTGSGFFGTQYATVGGVTVPSVQVVSDSQLKFYPPTGLSLGVHSFTVTNNVGTSNTSAFWYTNANPAELVIQSVVLGGTNANWTMGGVEFDFAFLVISLTNTTSPWMGWPLVNSPVVLWQGGLDDRGMATYSFPVPPMVFNGLQVYTQLIDIQGGTLNVRSLSGVKGTLVVL